MSPSKLISNILVVQLLFLSGCALTRIDPMNVLIRSDLIESAEQEKAILDKASLSWTEDGKVRVLFVSGTAYERGYQQGVLLRREVQENLNYIYKRVLDKFHFEELFSESYERARPFIPQEYVDEMHGLAHGARLPINLIHAIHILPSITEWGGKKKIKEVVKRMMDGEDLGTSCSNLCATKDATADGKMYTVRILDWGLHRISKLHEYPLITVGIPDKGNAYVNIGWVGFLGAISGMNEKGITLGEMGYGDPPGETLRGTPMPFMLRDVLANSSNLKDVRRIISQSPGDNSFIYLMSSAQEGKAELYLRDKSRFVVYKPGQEIVDRDNKVIPIENIVYGGHYLDKMSSALSSNKGKITPELLMSEIIPEIVMPSNFQNVVYDPKDLKFWVSNAKSPKEPAAQQPYTFFDFKNALAKFRQKSSAQ